MTAAPVQFQIPQEVRAALRPPEDLTVSEWCDRHRVLDAKSTAEPGPWDTARVPHAREILDAFADPAVGSIVWIKCARVSGTEFLNNALAYSVDARPMPTLYVLPTQDDVHDEFTGRIRRIFEKSPRLQGHVPGGNWASTETLHLDTMTVYGAYASAPSTLIRKTCGVVIFDEIDNCEAAAGRLGNTWKVAAERLVTFGYRAKLIGVTTPTTAQATGWQQYLASDRRRYHVPCPRCGTYQVLQFERIRSIDGVRDPDAIELEELVYYECESPRCNARIEPHWQKWMAARGVWVPECQRIAEPLPVHDAAIVERARVVAPDRWRPRLEGEPPRTRHRGYWCDALISPWRTWPQILAEWFRVKDDPETKRVFLNSWLARVWQEEIKTADIDKLRAKTAGSHPPDQVPDRAKILLCGADVQADHIYYVIRAWGLAEESWLIRHGRCESFDQLYKIAFQTGFPRVSRPEELLICTSLAIDSGFRTDEVYEFGKRPGVVVVKGVENAAYRTRPSRTDYYPTGKPKLEVSFYLVNGFLFKTKAHRLAMNPPGHAGEWHLHAETTEEYLQHFTAESAVLDRPKNRRGAPRLVWKLRSVGAANHWLDCEVYGLALADMLNVPLLREDVQPAALPPPEGAAAAPAPASRGWVRSPR